jgi:putative flippase GtrA
MVQAGREFWRFAAIGTLGFAIDAALFVLLNDAFGWPIASARVVSTVCAIAATWALNRRLTFAGRRSRRWAAELARYAFFQSAGLAVNVGTFALALWVVPPLRAVPVVALALGSGVAMLFNFATARTFAFRPDRA